jgi:hypothetical protein
MRTLTIGDKITVKDPVNGINIRVGIIDYIADELYQGVALSGDSRGEEVIFHVDNIIVNDLLTT